jgi:hypothetical protein
MGNVFDPEAGDSHQPSGPAGVNVVDLKDRFKTSLLLTPHSDIVALMVLEHQTGMLNRLGRAALETRMALHYEREMNKALGQPADEPSSSARSRIKSAGDEVVSYMLFQDEARLTDRVAGTSSFAADFAAHGPRDAKGRSLRDLELRTRLFRYPCSFLIYSRAFESLPAQMKDYIYQRLWDILSGRATESGTPRPSAADCAAIVEILRQTKRDLPEYWKTPILGSR